ncbi:MAG: hypothetical protein QW625_00040 [Candidatus Nanoarchaeia archaeon]
MKTEFIEIEKYIQKIFNYLKENNFPCPEQAEILAKRILSKLEENNKLEELLIKKDFWPRTLAKTISWIAYKVTLPNKDGAEGRRIIENYEKGCNNFSGKKKEILDALGVEEEILKIWVKNSIDGELAARIIQYKLDVISFEELEQYLQQYKNHNDLAYYATLIKDSLKK